MAPPVDPLPNLRVSLPSNHPNLLQGLEAWMQLGLISEAQLRSLCEEHLICAVPFPRINVPELGGLAHPPAGLRLDPTGYDSAVMSPFASVPRVEEGESSSQPEVQPSPPVPPVPRSPGPPVPRSPGPPGPPVPPVPRVVRAFMDELTVIWLLLLGVFLVVVSSVVLAATQWQQVSPVGQYTILLVYTLAFWQMGQWTARQDNLQATSRMLQVTTLLIIPINFWTIAAFGLGQRGVSGLGVAAIAALVLSAMTRQLLGSRPRWVWLNALGLSWLHWGWAFPGVPLVAIYGGVLGTAVMSWRFTAPRSRRGLILLVFANLLLMGRGWLTAGVPGTALGLAVALLGWSLWVQAPKVAHSEAQRRGIQGLGATGLLLGWLVTVGAHPLQSIAVGGLILGVLLVQVRRTRNLGLWGLALAMGLQIYIQLWRWVPETVRSQFVSSLETLLRTSLSGEQLLGLALFPYVIGLVVVAGGLRRREHLPLAYLTEVVALGLGGLALVPGVGNVAVRSLSLILGAITLISGYRLGRQRPAWLAYLAHGVTVLALLSIVDWAFPTASLGFWGLVFLGLTGVEWGLAWGLRAVGAGLLGSGSLWKTMGWHWGLVLASISYVLFQGHLFQLSLGEGWEAWNQALPPTQSYWALPWLAVPVLLTFLNYQHPLPDQRPLAGGLGAGASWLGVGLGMISAPTALVSLGTAALCTGVISGRLPQRILAIMAVGWGVMAGLVVVVHYQPWGLLDSTGSALILWGLWGLRAVVSRGAGPLAQRYVDALNGWAIAVAWVILLGATLVLPQHLGSWGGVEPMLPEQVLPALGLTVAAIAFRLWQQPTNLGYLALAWGAELLLLYGFVLRGQSLMVLATWHTALALGTQLAGDGALALARRRRQRPRVRLSWAVVPLAFGALAFGLAHLEFAASTGLYTLATGVVGIGVGRRQRAWGLFTVGGIGLLSLGAYELLGYQILQGSGGELGDAFVLCGLLAAAIAVGVGLGLGGLRRWWRWPQERVAWVGHLHWGLAVIQTIAAATAGMSPTFHAWGLALALGLAGYALWQGRRQRGWVYWGVAALMATVLYWLPWGIVEPWAAAIVAAIAVVLYELPWNRWGWPLRPWQRSQLIFPGVIAYISFYNHLISFYDTSPASYLLVGGFYGWMALREQQVRLSYVGIVLADIALFQLSDTWFADWVLLPITLLSVSLLYIAQVDPALQAGDRRQQRHWMRSLAVGLVCLTALIQAGNQLGPALLVALLGLGLGALGLGLRVRAYLYAGTITFALEVMNLLWTFISNQALLLWGLGILVGLALIWLAATFESRRSQAIALMDEWLGQLERWN